MEVKKVLVTPFELIVDKLENALSMVEFMGFVHRDTNSFRIMTETLILATVFFSFLVFMLKGQLFITVVTSHLLIVMSILIVRILVLNHGGFITTSILSTLVDHLLQVYVAARVSYGHWILIQTTSLSGLRCSLMLLNFLHESIMKLFLAFLEVQVEVISKLCNHLLLPRLFLLCLCLYLFYHPLVR